MLYASILGFTQLKNESEIESLMVWSGMSSNTIDPDAVDFLLKTGPAKAAKAVSAKTLFPSTLMNRLPAANQQLAKTLSEPLPDYSKVSEIQDLLKDKLLPIIDQGITFLTQLSDKGDFSLTLTIDEDEVEIDMTEVRLLLSGFYALKILSSTLVSYNLDFDQNGSYELYNSGTKDEIATHLIALANQNNSDFLKVRSGCQSLLDANPTNMIAGLQNAKSALTYCKNEVDNQSDDLLRNDELTDADYADGQEILDSLIKLFSGPVDLKIYDRTVSVDVRKLMTIPDLKAMLPYYEIYPYAVWHQAPVVYYTSHQECDYYSYYPNYDYYCNTIIDTEFFPIKFTDGSGQITIAGNDGMEHIDSLFDNGTLEIKDLANYVIFKDPTFNATLPGMTNNALWDLIQYIDEQKNVQTMEAAWKMACEPGATLAKILY